MLYGDSVVKVAQLSASRAGAKIRLWIQ